MGDQHAMNFRDFGRRQMRAGREIMCDLAKNPRPALRRAADHDRVRAGIFEHVLGLSPGW